MTSIQGLAGAGVHYAPAKPAPAVGKSEFGESAQTEQKHRSACEMLVNR